MPKIDAYGKDFRNFDAIIGSCNENGSLVPGHEPFKDDLSASVEQMRTLKLQQESLEGNRLAVTDHFLDALEEAKEKERKLKGFIVSVLGATNPLLALFGIAIKKVPNPNNRRRTKKPAKAKPPTTQPPADAPAAEAATNPPSAKPAA